MAIKYPIGLQNFAEIINNNYLYVDKTECVYRLIDSGKYYFLSRPRRFGKSLLVSTLKYLFAGDKHLFEGLYIYDKITWEKHPIIHISFTDIDFRNKGLDKAIHDILDTHAKDCDVILPQDTTVLKFKSLLKLLTLKYGKKVAVLIDEYDTPIISYLPDDMEKAKENRDILKNFYDVVKNSDEYIQFFFITGISKFSKVSIFSTLNNLADISFDYRFAAICGLTQEEINHHFSKQLHQIAQDMELSDEAFMNKVKFWYNGFCFSPTLKPKLYNPFTFLLFLSKGQFENHWFESGTPTFLVKMLRDEFQYDLENMELPDSVLRSFELERLDYRAILFQTGYITVKEKIMDNVYLMGYPNEEVRSSMLNLLLSEFLEIKKVDGDIKIFQLQKLLNQGDVAGVISYIDQLFSTIPYELFQQRYENFYHAIVFMTFRLLSLRMQGEVHHRSGAIDAVIETPQYVYIFEFKVSKSAKFALEQIKINNYHTPYLDAKKKIFMVGVKFSATKRGVHSWKMETI